MTAATSIVADVAAVRTDRQLVAERLRRDYPLWDDEDIHWAVEGIARMDPEPFARRFKALARLQLHTPDRIIAAAPTAYVLVDHRLISRTLRPTGAYHEA